MRLSRQEEREYALRAQRGDQSAFDVLLHEHQPYIQTLVWEHLRPGIEEADLRQAGEIGFWRALQRFKVDMGNRLWTFARPRVKSAISDFRRWWIGLKDEERRNLPRILEAIKALQNEHGQEPAEEEIALVCEFEVDYVRNLLRTWSGRTVTFEEVGDLEPAGPAPGLMHGAMGRVDARLQLQDRFRAALRGLGQQKGSKWLVLFLLHEYCGYSWDEVCDFLSDPVADIEPLWRDIQEYVSEVVPGTWYEVYETFQNPPPFLNRNALRLFYHRGRKALLRSGELS